MEGNFRTHHIRIRRIHVLKICEVKSYAICVDSQSTASSLVADKSVVFFSGLAIALRLLHLNIKHLTISSFIK